MRLLRITLAGILFVAAADLYLDRLSLVWTLSYFCVASLAVSSLTTVGFLLWSALALIAISTLYQFGLTHSVPATFSEFSASLNKPYIVLFSYFFVPMIFLTWNINLYDVLPNRGGARRFGIARLFLIQVIHRRSALVRRASEIFVALELRGTNISHALQRVLYAPRWVPILVSTAFVEALESSDYERMMQLELSHYAGVFRCPSKGARFMDHILDGAIILLGLGVLASHVFGLR